MSTLRLLLLCTLHLDLSVNTSRLRQVCTLHLHLSVSASRLRQASMQHQHQLVTLRLHLLLGPSRLRQGTSRLCQKPAVAHTWPAPVGCAALAAVDEYKAAKPAAHGVYASVAPAPVVEYIAPAASARRRVLRAPPCLCCSCARGRVHTLRRRPQGSLRLYILPAPVGYAAPAFCLERGSSSHSVTLYLHQLLNTLPWRLLGTLHLHRSMSALRLHRQPTQCVPHQLLSSKTSLSSRSVLHWCMAPALAGSGHRRTRPFAIVSFLNRGFVRVCGSPETLNCKGPRCQSDCSQSYPHCRVAKRPVVVENSMKSGPAAEVWERAAFELCRFPKHLDVHLRDGCQQLLSGTGP